MFPLLKTVPVPPSLGKALLDASPAFKFAGAASAAAFRLAGARSAVESVSAARIIGGGLAETVGKQLAYRAPVISSVTTAVKDLSLVDTTAYRLAGAGVLDGGLGSLGRRMSRRYVFDDAIASAGWGVLRFADTTPLFGVSARLKELSLLDPGIARLSARAAGVDSFAKTISAVAGRSPSPILGFSALGKSPLTDLSIGRFAVPGVAGGGLGTLDGKFNPFGDAVSAVWKRGFVMDGLLAPLRSITRLIESLGAPIVWLARAALDAYLHNDPSPMREFLSTHLRIRPATEDHAQALALALILREWETQVDLHDAAAVRAALRTCAREGTDLDGDHQVMGYRIRHLPEGTDLLSRDPGPETLAMTAVVPWAENFDNRDVRNATRQLKERDQHVARVWAENDPITWLQAPQLVGQDTAVGEQVRRRLRRLGNEIAARAEAQARREI
ncbi:hypothetical protein [Streptomyces sp. NBC_00728]|uniref:hypothetical protein n=1 Tax=Streptomyces sp. NBC_00728 TaxID=2903676 RepID=UPI0038687F4C